MASQEHLQLIDGTYQLIRLIGTGSMGEVYQAQNLHTNQRVAIKHLKPRAIEESPEMIERFKREAQALRQLDHPNIVKMLATIEQNDQYYLVMEYVGGGSLADLLKRQPRLSIDQILKFGLEIADALTRTHHLKIIHRDLKPANVLLANDDTVRLTDFGIAYLGTAERMTENGMVIGTLPYLSPEALNSEAANTSSDIWGFGVMLFEMLVGRLPFIGQTLAQLVPAILTQPLPDLEALRPESPIALADLIYRMLEKEPQQRINSARIIGAELEAISRELHTPLLYRRAHSHLNSAPSTISTQHKQSSHNLPAQTTAFVGREVEIQQLSALLATPDIRLITILAPGGMGKTRLALETAKFQLESFSDGVFLVSLAPINTSEAIVRAIADTARYSFSGSVDPKQQLLHVLSNKRILFILDNFEHLLSGAGLVDEILQAAPEVKIVATSRSKLNLQGENLFLIQGMETPVGETIDNVLNYSSIKLFMQTAQRVQPNFELKADNLVYITQICQQVEGLPLGIVLAAAWVDTLSLKEISDEIAKNLDFLETEHQNVPTRQRSIQAVFDYSWTLLSVEERKIFTRLSVFQGDFTRDAAESVAGATLKTLAALVNKSMLRRNSSSGRYTIHELLRQYAARKLDEASLANETRKAHSDYFANYMGERLLDMQGRRQTESLREIDAEFNNLRAAWLYLQNHHTTTDRLANFALAFWMYFDLRSRHQEGCLLFGDAIQVLRTLPTNTHLDFLIGFLLGLEAYHQAGIGAFDACEKTAKEGISKLEAHQNFEALAIAWCGLSLGYGVGGNPRFVQATATFAEFALKTNSQWLIARAYLWLGLGRWANPEEAQRYFKMCLGIAEEIGDVFFVAAAYLRLGHLARDLKVYGEAKHYAEQALPYFEKVGQPWSINQTQNLLGEAEFNLKDYANARNHFQQALRAYRSYATVNDITFFVLRNIEILAEQTPNARAVELLSLICNHPDNKSNQRRILAETAKTQAVLAEALPSRAYATAWERGKTLDLTKVVEELLILS